MFEKEIPIYDFVHAIAEAVDLVSPVLNNHQKKVAYISYRIAQEMHLPLEDIQDIILASMLHDIGAFSIGERINTLKFEPFETDMNQHASIGYKLLKDFAPLANAATLIKYHHTNFDVKKKTVPIGSYIIHLADRICVILDEHLEILAQVPHVHEKIVQGCYRFHPDALAALNRLTGLEYFWIEAFSPSFSASVLRSVLSSKKDMDLEILFKFAKVIAQIIDFRSRFTATHSSGVAAVARDLTTISGFSESECKLMEIAGYLHDLGKLAVPNHILEKNGKLNKNETNSIRKHTYYTHAILSSIKGMEDVAVWASYHHERQDGKGYPFHVQGEDFSRLARVMAVADIFTALAEDRPYRRGMDRKQIAEVLLDMAKNGGIDKNIVELANENFPRINDVRIKAQQDAKNDYLNFA
jgi:HD-GYP domain-containing protein (c-di-GMP phosphodiesterase class II)